MLQCVFKDTQSMEDKMCLTTKNDTGKTKGCETIAKTW